MPNPVIVAQAAAVAAPIVEDVYKKAQGIAQKAITDAVKALKCNLYPCRCEVQKRNAAYLSTYATVMKEAKSAADGGDFVTGYALATSAANLDRVQPFAGYLSSSGSKPPNCTWTTGAETMATKAILADALADGYEANAQYQMERGQGGTHRAAGAGIPTPLLIGGAVLAAALLLGGGFAGGRRGGGSNGR